MTRICNSCTYEQNLYFYSSWLWKCPITGSAKNNIACLLSICDKLRGHYLSAKLWCVYKCCLNFLSYILLVHTCKWILNIPYMHTLCVIFSYFYSIAIGQLQCDFKYFALHFFRYFFNSTRTTKNTFYILFKWWSLLYFEEKRLCCLVPMLQISFKLYI